eukprot:GHVT01014812.1.p1 GENE.GHVT01014812.1~~GHVT01014812.1.p1  ORF type:complete len:156 (+),score=46.89 GHVT01014812.1:126-593(+)
MSGRGRGGSSRGRGKPRGRGRAAGHRHVSTFEEVERRNAEMEASERRGGAPAEEEESEEESEEEEEENAQKKQLAASRFVEDVNPNYSTTPVEKTGVVELRRREREELEFQKRDRIMDKLRAEGKTKQSAADLKRLAEVRAAREAAARQRALDQQ